MSRRLAALVVLPVALGLLALAGAAGGAPERTHVRSGNLVFNGSFEKGPAGDGLGIVDIPGWEEWCGYDPYTGSASRCEKQRGHFTVVRYGAPERSSPSPAGGIATFPRRGVSAGSGGKVLFYGPGYGGSSLFQTVDLRDYAGVIDSGRARALLHAEVGVRAGSEDRPALVVHWNYPRPPPKATDAYGNYGSLELPYGLRGCAERLRNPPVMVSCGTWGRIPKGVRWADVEIRHSGPGPHRFWAEVFLDGIRLEVTDDPKATSASGGETAKPRGGPSVKINPSIVTRGTTGTITGSGWPVGVKITLMLGRPANEATPIHVSRTSAQGTFNWKFTIGVTAQPGTYVLVVCDRDCRLRAQTTFRVV